MLYIWIFFDRTESQVSKIKCNQYQAVISPGVDGKSSNNTSMFSHINYKDSELMHKLTNMLKSSPTEQSTSVFVFRHPFHQFLLLNVNYLNK